MNISVVIGAIFSLINTRGKQKFIPKCAYVFGANLSLISEIFLHNICTTNVISFLFCIYWFI